ACSRFRADVISSAGWSSRARETWVRLPPLRELQVLRDRGLHELFERSLGELLPFVNVDGPPYVAFQARVEQPVRVLKGGTSGEGEFHHLRVGLTRANDPVMGPHRGAHPLPLFDDPGIRLLDEGAHARKHVATPIP